LALADAFDNPRLLAIAYQQLGWLEIQQGNTARARTLLEKGLELRRRLGDRKGIAHALGCLGDVEPHEDMERAIAYWHEEKTIFEELGNVAEVAHALNRVGNMYYWNGDYEAARQVYSEALDTCRTIQDNAYISYIRMNLGCALFHLGDAVRAKELHRQALPNYLQTGSEEGISWSLERLAVVEASYGEAQRAARLIGAASIRREESGIPMDAPDKQDWEAAIAAVRATLADDTLFDAIWQEGCAMTLEQAVALALEGMADGSLKG
jgi:non-specific serine/threonine protein kinase